MKKISRNLIFASFIVVLLFFAIATITWLFFQKEKDLLPEIKTEAEEEKDIAGLLENLTPKKASPLIEEEKAKLQETLETLTPTKSRALTEKKQKEIDELLKQLTPQ